MGFFFVTWLWGVAGPNTKYSVNTLFRVHAHDSRTKLKTGTSRVGVWSTKVVPNLL